MDLQSGGGASSSLFSISYCVLEERSMEDELKRYEIMHTIQTHIQTIGWTVSDLLPDIDPFVNFLSRLCTDFSLKIHMFSLDILEVLIERTYCEVVHLEMFMECLLKCLACCDRKISMNSTQLIHRLMHYVHPMAVIQQLLENINGLNSSLHVEIINRITAGLFYCWLYNFDLNHLCFVIAFLKDLILQVQQATVECLVTLGYVMLMTGHPLIDFGEYLKKACHISKSSLKVIISRARKGWLPSCSMDGQIWNVNCFPPGANSTFGNTSDDSCLTSRASTADSRWKVEYIFTLPKTVVDDHWSTKKQKSVVNELPRVEHPLDLHKNLHFIHPIENEDELTASQLFSDKYVASVHVSTGKHNVVSEDDSSVVEVISEVFTPQLSMCDSNQYPESATSSVHVGDHPNESSFRKSLSLSSVDDSLNKKEHEVNEASAISINLCDRSDGISPIKVPSCKALLRLGSNKSKSLINNVIDEDDDAFEKMIDAQSEIKLFLERRASEQWSSNIDFLLRCQACHCCHWTDSFEEKIRSQDPFEKFDQPQLILKQACDAISDNDMHPNKAVRETAAQFLTLLTQKLRPKKSLTSNLVNPMLSTAAQFVMDGSRLTRVL